MACFSLVPIISYMMLAYVHACSKSVTSDYQGDQEVMVHEIAGTTTTEEVGITQPVLDETYESTYVVVGLLNCP